VALLCSIGSSGSGACSATPNFGLQILPPFASRRLRWVWHS